MYFRKFLTGFSHFLISEKFRKFSADFSDFRKFSENWHHCSDIPTAFLPMESSTGLSYSVFSITLAKSSYLGLCIPSTWQYPCNNVGTHVHWARNPGYEIQPCGFVTTVLLTSGPQGMMGQTLKRFWISVGDKQPSLSWNKCLHQITELLWKCTGRTSP